MIRDQHGYSAASWQHVRFHFQPIFQNSQQCTTSEMNANKTYEQRFILFELNLRGFIMRAYMIAFNRLIISSSPVLLMQHRCIGTICITCMTWREQDSIIVRQCSVRLHSNNKWCTRTWCCCCYTCTLMFNINYSSKINSKFTSSLFIDWV